MGLIKKAEKIFKEINIKELQKAGIVKDTVKLYADSQIIVTYPPLQACKKINPQKIFSVKPKSKRKIDFYLHCPFCTGKCLYCGFVSLPNQPKEFVEKYLNAVEKEINLLKKFPYFNNTIGNSIYFGGGTPNYLSAEQLNRLCRLINGSFEMRPEIEFTVEVSPETVIAPKGIKKLKTLQKNGVNRISIGFQTFSNRILKFVKRRHSSEQAIEAYKLIRKVGFDNINIDLIPGLPNQTLKVWQNDLERTVKLNPASITCYPLVIKRNAAMWALRQQEKRRYPSQNEIVKMQIMVNEFLREKGYVQNSVWSFANKKPEYLYKQLLHKWSELGEQLALGVSTYSFINDFQYFNYRTIPEYIQALDKERLPIWKGSKLSKEELARRLVVQGIRGGFSKSFFKKRFNKEPKEINKKIWHKLERFDIISEKDDQISLSDKGKLFADEIAKQFYSKRVKKILKN